MLSVELECPMAVWWMLKHFQYSITFCWKKKRRRKTSRPSEKCVIIDATFNFISFIHFLFFILKKYLSGKVSVKRLRSWWIKKYFLGVIICIYPSHRVALSNDFMSLFRLKGICAVIGRPQVNAGCQFLQGVIIPHFKQRTEAVLLQVIKGLYTVRSIYWHNACERISNVRSWRLKKKTINAVICSDSAVLCLLNYNYQKMQMTMLLPW